MNTLQHIPDILSVFTGTEGRECQSLVFPGCTVFFEDIKQKYMLNRSNQLLVTHAQLSFHFHPIFLLGILAVSPLLCPQVLCSSELPHSLHSPAPWSREGHGLLVLTKSSNLVLVPAQLEKQHRQKALICDWRVNKPISVYFLYDPVAVLGKQVPAISFRGSASLINTMILLLIKLFEKNNPCASTFALMGLTPMFPHLQRHRESKWTMTEPPFLNE